MEVFTVAYGGHVSRGKKNYKKAISREIGQYTPVRKLRSKRSK
jgi:hypothetical protein